MVIKDWNPRSLEYIAKHDTIDQDRAESYYNSSKFDSRYSELSYLAHISRQITKEAEPLRKYKPKEAISLYQDAIEGLNLIDMLDQSPNKEWGYYVHEQKRACNQLIDPIKKDIVKASLIIKDWDPRVIQYIVQNDILSQSRIEGYYESYEFDSKYTEMEYLGHVSRIVHLNANSYRMKNPEKALPLYHSALEGFNLLEELAPSRIYERVSILREGCIKSIKSINRELARASQDDSTT